MSKASETRAANRAKREAKEEEKRVILTVMKECLLELLEENELSSQAKLSAVKMLDEIIRELYIVR